MIPKILSSSASVSQAVNNSAALFCLVSGYPLPIISWIKDGTPVVADSSITITTRSATSVSTPEVLKQFNTTFTGDVGVVSVLQISSLKRKDNGKYVCQAMNSFKQTETYNASTRTIIIQVIGKKCVNISQCSNNCLHRCA